MPERAPGIPHRSTAPPGGGTGGGGGSGGGSTGGFSCHIGYSIGTQWARGFGARITINNTGTTPISSWTLTWAFPNGQTVTQSWNGIETQSGANVSVVNESYNCSWNNVSNAAPPSFAVNGVVCQ
jgi:hypothetical protein